MTIDKKKLRALANKASLAGPHPWEFINDPIWERETRIASIIYDGADLRFLAAANPQIVCALLDEIKILRGALRYCSYVAAELHPLNQAQFIVARETLEKTQSGAE